ncbi:hypothetical protein AA11825_2408 [Acetobacter pomorum DSM 11825]|nr:hypothetical protein AA11825_2408 [Acetobacter pomorum DSM 11825]
MSESFVLAITKMPRPDPKIVSNSNGIEAMSGASAPPEAANEPKTQRRAKINPPTNSISFVSPP